MLDNLYEEYAKLIEDVMNDRDRLLKEGLDLFAQTGADVQDVIKDAAEEHGYEMTEEMEKIISSIEGMGSLDSYLGVGGTVTQSLDGIAAEIRNTYTSLSSDFRSISGSLNSTGHEGDYSTAGAAHRQAAHQETAHPRAALEHSLLTRARCRMPQKGLSLAGC